MIVCTLALAITSAHAATVAYWRFETGPANTLIQRTGGVNGYNYSLDIPDVSGNGNHLAVWDQGGAGFLYRTDVPTSSLPFNGATNNFSIKNNSSWPATFTYSAYSNPTGIDIEAMTPLEWTIEASFKPEDGGHRTYVGRDGRNVGTSNGDLACLYFKINPDDDVSIAFADVSGYWHEATSVTGITQGFIYGNDPDGLTGHWYNMAAVCDGKTLSLYLDDVDAGTGYQLVAQTDLTLSGSPDTRLTNGTEDGGDWHAGGWSVGRGLYAGGHTDRAYGYIDEVRISNKALDPIEFLHSPRVIAWNPSPADGQTDVGASTGSNSDVEVTVAWNTGMDPDNLNVVNPEITAYYLYLSTDPNLPSTDMETLSVSSPIGATASFTTTRLMDQTYYWRVDQSTNGTGPTDPNTITGPVWQFDTIKSIPIITKQPQRVIVAPDDTAEFSVTVSSISDAYYQWFMSTDNANNTLDDDTTISEPSLVNTLSLTEAQTSDEGYYYCIVTNSGGTATSATAPLAVRRIVAHWTMDAVDFVDGQYLDVTGEGHHADPNGAPAFVSGQIGEGVNIARVSTDPYPTTDSWANVGSWNPSQFSGQITVSFWLNWTGANGTWQSFIAKRNGNDWGDANVYWQICTGDNNTELWWQSPDNLLATQIGGTEGQWQQVTVTTDGTNGVLYINGEQKVSAAFHFGNATDAPICLGGNGFDINPREWMNGSLDNVRIYNYSMSEMDVARLYVQDAPGMSACVQSIRPAATFDLNNDCIVNILDIAIFSAEWLDCSILPDCIQ